MTKVRELMSTEVVSVAPELTLRSALELFVERHISGAPVMAGSRLVGVISASDILAFETTPPGEPEAGEEAPAWELEPSDEGSEGDDAPAAFFSDLSSEPGVEVREKFEEPEGPEAQMLKSHTVSEIMTRRVVSVTPETTAVVAARLMSGLQIHRLVVLDHGELRGVLSTLDLVRAIAQGRL
jgi:CBS domain-containing protein